MESRIAKTETDDAFILKVDGELNMSNAEEFEKELILAIQKNHKTLILDFSVLKYISSAAIRIIILCSKKLSSVNKKFKCFFEGNSKIKEIFSIAGLYSVLDIKES